MNSVDMQRQSETGSRVMASAVLTANEALEKQYGLGSNSINAEECRDHIVHCKYRCFRAYEHDRQADGVGRWGCDGDGHRN